MTKLKKIIASLLVASACLSPVVAEESSRLAELSLNLPISISNNTIGLVDIFVPELVIDLGDFADRMPNAGLIISGSVDPSVGVKVRVPYLCTIGATMGVNIYTRFQLSKDVFTFIGHGNSVEEDLDIKEGIGAFADAFVYVQGDVGLNLAGFKITATPAVFTTLYHAVTDNSYVEAFNRLDGTFGYKLNGNFDIYSPIPISQDLLTIEYYTNLDPAVWNAIGFDCGFGISKQITDMINIRGNCRVPIMPSHLTSVTGAYVTSEYETSVNEISTGEIHDGQFDYGLKETQTADYIINRPFKINAYGDFSLAGGMLLLTGGLGLGVEHPFAPNKDEMGVYYEYLLAARLNFLNMINVTASTELTDQIYRNSISAGINIRFVELNLGASLSSSTFASSFRGDGLSAFVNLTIGL